MDAINKSMSFGIFHLTSSEKCSSLLYANAWHRKEKMISLTNFERDESGGSVVKS